MSDLYAAGFLLLLGAAGAVAWGFAYRCGKCRRLWALRRTGEERRHQGIIGEVIECAYRCKHCEDTHWQVQNRRDWPGGGGIGGGR